MTLRIERLSKTYENGTVALRDVSLEIPKGMFGLLGPTGAGKSTLMRTIAMLQAPGSGTVAIDVLKQPELLRQLGYAPRNSASIHARPIFCASCAQRQARSTRR